ncbi:energy transducer TonB [Rhizobacter sp. J219]|uniref:energy transducer TonB n=1 Tax=Rhizobacter sp. J219 TaxID=2898430 RepID=UPI0021515180|nr:energy transducer TonB [Rhizobacter sp. J219]MCR5884746.1 energy transducer TonB [Rhizobacter sp. J219]
MPLTAAPDALPDPLALAARRVPVQRRDGLSRAQYRAVVAAIAAVHVMGIYGILQVPAVRASVLEAAPIFVDLLAPPAPPVPAPPPPPPLKPVLKRPEPPLITTAPSPAPAPFEAAPAPEVPVPPAPVVAEAPTAPPAPPAPPPPPKIIPAEAVQYLVRPVGEYPRMSIRMGETGLVMVRVYIDEGGMPRQVVVEKSSGFPRLDEAAVVAVRGARFKPYLFNGAPTAGWARIPIPFELEK